MSEPDDLSLSYDPRTWFDRPSEAPAAPAAKSEPKRARRTAPAGLVAGIAASAILIAGAATAYAMREPAPAFAAAATSG